MHMLVQVIIFLASVGIVWFFAGILIDSVNRIAHRYCRTGFFTAFFILGALTSISEFSVATNAALAGVPGVSVGNLVGASFVILLFVVPVLAIAGGRIPVNSAVSKKNLFLMLFTAALPALLVIDGNVTRAEGLLAILAYATVAYALYRQKESIDACDAPVLEAVSRTRSTLADVGRILLGSAAIFAAAHFLVEQAVYFATALSVPASLIGLLLLSIGTNIPELVIAARAIMRRSTDVALGDYLGSAAMNTFIFGGLAVVAGTFWVEPSEFIMTTVLFASGLLLLFFIASSRKGIPRRAGFILLAFYLAFVALQLFNVLRFSAD